MWSITGPPWYLATGGLLPAAERSGPAAGAPEPARHGGRSMRHLGLFGGSFDPPHVAHLVAAVEGGEINGATGKALFAELCAGSFNVRAAIADRGLAQISDDAALEQIAEEVMAANPQAIADWRAGRQQAIGFLVGQAMKESKGRGNPARFGEIIRRRLDAE